MPVARIQEQSWKETDTIFIPKETTDTLKEQ